MSGHSLAISVPIRCLPICTDVHIGLTDVASKISIPGALSGWEHGPPPAVSIRAWKRGKSNNHISLFSDRTHGFSDFDLSKDL